MSLERAVYQELEAVVGKDNISEKEYILAGNRASVPSDFGEYHSAEAILMPGSTEEVQAIVRICNRYGIKFIPTVSGLFPSAYAKAPGTILLHLKRMNKIIEINEADRYVVIEPGVRHVQLRPELMRRGLSYTVASVGPGGSVLVNFIFSGDHHNQHGTSRANRYIEGVEWVTPEGKIIRTGSLATGSGWFAADGPGPSLRALIKGYAGAQGNFGIVTRVAIGLDEYRGGGLPEVEGLSPHYSIRIPKARGKVFVYKYGDLARLRDAIVEIGKAEIAFTVLKYFYLPLAQKMSESAEDFWRLWNGAYKTEMERPLIVYLSTWSEEELAYEEKVLAEIVAETGGTPVDESIRSWFDDNMDFFILVSFLQRVLRLGGGWAPIKLGADSVKHIFDVGMAVPEFMLDFTETGKILDAPHDFQIIPMEYGHMAHIELLFMWDRNDPDAQKNVMEFIRRSGETDRKHGYHAEMPPFVPALLDVLGPLYSNVQIWAKELKEALDPNNVANPL
jgi:glycolate oxidase